MSSKVFGTIGKIAGVVAGVAMIGTGIGAALGGTMVFSALGASVAASTIATVAGAVAMGASMLSRPKAPATSTEASDRLNVSIDPRTPRKFVLGRTAMATDIRDQEFSDDQELLHRFLVTASHQAAAYEEIWLDDKLAWSALGGIAAEFNGYLGVECYTVGSAANAKNISTRMGSTRRYTGLAWVYLRFKLTGNSKKAESPFASSIPTRLTIVGKGALTYDPRLDSTVAGGSGSMRPDDQTTWAWNDDASRNPAIQLLWYLLGWRIQNPVTGEWRLAVGKGIPAARIDLASFITAANLCDEPVALVGGGAQPRYRSDGVFSEGDATNTVLDQLKASMNAELDDVDGKIRITVLHNDLASPVADFTDDDVLSGFTWDQTAPLDETYNVVRGTFIDPSDTSLYQALDYPEVRIPSPDGIDRVEPVDFQTVQDDRQAQRLVKQRIARMLYSGQFTATFSYRAWKVQKNDVVRLTFGALGWTNKLFRVVQTSVQVNGEVPMILQEEHEDIYLWDRDESPAIQPVEPTRYDPYLNPIVQDVIEPKYDDGTPIDNLRPAEPGATDGANQAEKAKLAELDADAAQFEIDLAAAQSTISSIQSDAAATQAELEQAQAEILANGENIETINTTLGSYDARITTAQTTADNAAGQLASLSTTVSTQGASIAQNASAITATQGSLATLTTTVSATSPVMNRNSTFADWVSGTLPKGWSEWYSPEGTITKVAGNYGNAVRFASTAPFSAVGQGFWTYGTAEQPAMSNAGPGYYTISCEVTLESGSLVGAGLRLQGYDSGGSIVDAANNPVLIFATEPDVTGSAPGAGTAGRTYRFSKMVRLNSTSIRELRLVASQHQDAQGAEVSKTLVWHKVECRAATSQDVAVETQATALSTLTTQYAALSTSVSTQGASIAQNASAITATQGSLASLTTTVSATSPVMNRNSTFSDLGSGTFPTGWANWYTPEGTITKVAGNYGNAVRFASTAPFSAVGQGFWTYGTAEQPAMSNAGPGYYTISCEVTLESGSLVGAGLRLQGYDSGGTYISGAVDTLVFATEPDATGSAPGAGTAGRTYRFSKMVRLTSTSIRELRLVASQHQDAQGAETSKTLVWHKVECRAATSQDVAVETQATALSTLTSQYASLSSTVSSQGVTISSQQTAITTINGNVTTLFGRAALTITAGNIITGWEINNNGSTGDFAIRADRFRITPTSGSGARTEFSSGNWRVYDASNVLRVRMGVW